MTVIACVCFDYETKKMQYLVLDRIQFIDLCTLLSANARIISSSIFINQDQLSLSCSICDFIKHKCSFPFNVIHRTTLHAKVYNNIAHSPTHLKCKSDA